MSKFLERMIERAALESWEKDAPHVHVDQRMSEFRDCYVAAFAAGVAWTSDRLAKIGPREQS